MSGLWEEIKNSPEIGSFRNFVLALNYLYAIGAIEYERGVLSRSR